MKRFLVLNLLATLLATTSYAQIPSGYYDNADGETGSALKDSLNNIIDAHTEFVYDHSTNTDVWDILKAADYSDSNSDNVVCFYTGWERDADLEYDNAYGWTREHVWAKQHGDFGTTKGPGTDCHALRPSDNSVNNKRNSRWFDDGGTEFIDAQDAYEGTGATGCYFSTNWTWEPRDAVKGDVARCLFYMATRYEGENGEVDLELIDYIPTDDDDPDPEHAKLSVLLQWHLDDPVDDYERRRNDSIYAYQVNRNPFIDHPEYVCEIWGGTCTTTSDGVFISEYIEGSSYNKAIELYNNTGASVDLSDYTLKKQSNGSGNWSSGLALSGTLAAGAVYVICHSSASSSLTSVADLSTSNTSINFNGNDPVGLFKDGDLIDIVGTFDGGSSDFAKDETLVRKATVSESNTTYTAAEWDSYSQDTFTYIDNHDGPQAASDLMISEYVEGSSYNKVIEIYNGTGASVSLSNYSLKKNTNGGASWSSALTLSGTLADGATYVICHSSASSSVTSIADLSTSNTAINFNGNDPVGLFNNGTLIDIVGTFNGGSGDFAKDVTLVRKSSIEDPSTTYSSSDWDSYAKDTFSYLGDHTYGGGGGSSGSVADLIISEYIEGSSYNKAIEIYNGSGASVDLGNAQLKKNSNGGSSWSSGLSLSGTLADGEVYVVAHSSASSSVTDEADLTTSSSVMNFNGNDPIGLFDGSTLVDVVGTFNGGSGNFAANTTLVRKSTVSDPNTTYTVSEWDSYSEDTFSYLGSHTASKTSLLATSDVDVWLRSYPNPVSDILNITSAGLEDEIIAVNVMDLNGKLVLQDSLTLSTRTSIDLSDLQAGYYVLVIQNQEIRSVQQLVKL